MPFELPPAPPAVSIERPHTAGLGSAPSVVWQDPQAPIQIPQSDIFVEVVGRLPMQAQIQDMSRLLGQRSRAEIINRAYPPTILELLTLVKRNPARPRDGSWNSIEALTIGYNADAQLVTMSYCVDYCSHDPKTGAFHPKRKMVSYSASEAAVTTRLNKKLKGLKKYAK
jgi:hypothetical protein